jgi:predicted ATPase
MASAKPAARHQTLRQAIAWSYDLLDDAEQVLFRQLGVFVGGCRLDAAETVCGTHEARGKEQGTECEVTIHLIPILDRLTALIDKSLLQQTQDTDEEPRFTMLEAIREYALERLEDAGEAEAVRQRHAAYYLALAEEVEPRLQEPNRVTWLDQLEADLDNIRMALQWLLTIGAVESAARLSGALHWFWRRRWHMSEGRQWLNPVLAHRSILQPKVRLKVLEAAGELARIQCDDSEAHALYKESLALCHTLGDQEGIARMLKNLGIIAMRRRSYRRCGLAPAPCGRWCGRRGTARG